MSIRLKRHRWALRLTTMALLRCGREKNSSEKLATKIECHAAQPSTQCACRLAWLRLDNAAIRASAAVVQAKKKSIISSSITNYIQQILLFFFPQYYFLLSTVVLLVPLLHDKLRYGFCSRISIFIVKYSMATYSSTKKSVREREREGQEKEYSSR